MLHILFVLFLMTIAVQKLTAVSVVWFLVFFDFKKSSSFKNHIYCKVFIQVLKVCWCCKCICLDLRYIISIYILVISLLYSLTASVLKIQYILNFAISSHLKKSTRYQIIISDISFSFPFTNFLFFKINFIFGDLTVLQRNLCWFCQLILKIFWGTYI